MDMVFSLTACLGLACSSGRVGGPLGGGGAVRAGTLLGRGVAGTGPLHSGSHAAGRFAGPISPRAPATVDWRERERD